MTKQTQNIEGSEPPAQGVAGAPEIEITPAMMEAGIDAMYAWYASNDPPDWGVRPIYEAMVRARGCQNDGKA